MPIILVIDFETTGMEPPEAKVCEGGWCPLIQNGAAWDVGLPETRLFGVEIMPPEVQAIHHISLDEVRGLPGFDPAAFLESFPVDVFAAHNAEFEAKFLGPLPKPMLCTYKAALRVWPDAPSHSNGVLRYWLANQGLLSLDHDTAMPPHRAGPDAYVTAHILKALLGFTTAREMCAWTKEPRLLPRCPLGKFRGKPWAEVETGFLNWMLNQPTMEEDLKWNAQRELTARSER